MTGLRSRLALRTRLRQAVTRADPLFAKIGLRVLPYGKHWDRHPTADFPPEWHSIIRRVRPYTMTSDERVGALLQSVEHVAKNRIPGSFVECGVWRGGSVMAAAFAFQGNDDLRDLYLFDTFEGMSEPTEDDVSYLGQRATDGWHPGDAAAGLEDVRRTLALTGYPEDRVNYIKGKVEDTLPGAAPRQIAILRLDTDWYESTRHELETLWPHVMPGGVLIVDDYGHFTGARQAVDEFFGPAVFLHRVDYTGRLVLKH
jgi:hypothetical protein